MKKAVLFGFLTLAVLALNFQSSFSQYKNAIGGRFGVANGITFKTFNKNDRALDFILNFESRNGTSSFRFTGLYEIHNPINAVPALHWYYGFGGTLGSRKYTSGGNSELLLGVDGIIGLDYKFRDVPINLALDWKPTMYVSPNTEFNAEGLGISLRFTF